MVPSNEVKLAHALFLRGDTSKAPITHTALAMGGCLNCLLVPLCPTGSLLLSLPEPGRLIKTREVLAWGTRRASRASDTGTAPAWLLALQQQALLEVVAAGSQVGNCLAQQTWGSSCLKAGCSLLWSRGLGCIWLPPVPAHQRPSLYFPSAQRNMVGLSSQRNVASAHPWGLLSAPPASRELQPPQGTCRLDLGVSRVPSTASLVLPETMRSSTQPLGCGRQAGQQCPPPCSITEETGHSRACPHSGDGEVPKHSQKQPRKASL